MRLLSELTSQREPIQLRLGIYAAVAVAFLALLPQLHLWAVRGSDWQGSYVSFDFDEVAYSSYLSALISGRPRRNDPYTGRDDFPGQPQAESLHSIQLVPAYALALPARVLGLSAAKTFILVRVLAALVTTLALFWLLTLITGDSCVSAAGAIVVLCLGGLAGEPFDAWRILSFGGVGETLPFLRRYVPAAVFFLFFIFAGLVWQSLTTNVKKVRVTRAVLAGVMLAILVFSYFFLWTTAIAWLFIIALLWLAVRRGETSAAIVVFGTIAAFLVLALLPYCLLLSKRAPTIDAAQLLTRSRAPVFSLPVIIGLVVFFALAIAAWRGCFRWRDPAVLFATSFALLPAITFNQQVVTGLLLQPVHYGRYSANYASVLAVVLATTLIWRARGSGRRISSRAFAVAAIVVLVWSAVETGVRTFRMGAHSSARDDAYRVAWRLRDLAEKNQPGIETHNSPPVIFCSNLWLADELPNEAPQPILWAPHLFVFSGSTNEENRERLYGQLYYSGVNEEQFAQLAGNFSFLQLAIFGWERMNQKPYALPITDSDIQRETQLYREYLANFGASQAASTQLAYVVVPAVGGPSFTNLDEWYERDAGERIGDYMLYRVSLRSLKSRVSGLKSQVSEFRVSGLRFEVLRPIQHRERYKVFPVLTKVPKPGVATIGF